MLERRADFNMFCPAVNSQATASEQQSVCCLHLWLIPDVCWISLFCLRMVGYGTSARVAFRLFPLSVLGSFSRP